MQYKLYLDDIRYPPAPDYILARNMEEAKGLIAKKGFPSHISFDHNLGIDTEGKLLKSGYDFAKWIVGADQSGEITIPQNFTFSIHSANPVGAQNISALLTNYLSYKQREEELLGYTTATLRQQYTRFRVIWVYTCFDSPIPMMRIRTNENDTGTGMLKHSVLMSIAQEPTYLQETDSDGKSLDAVSEKKSD